MTPASDKRCALTRRSALRLPVLALAADPFWGLALETPDVLAINMQNEQKNLTTLAMDIQLRTMIPYFRAPLGDEADSHGGFKVVEAVTSQEYDVGLWPPV